MQIKGEEMNLAACEVLLNSIAPAAKIKLATVSLVFSQTTCRSTFSPVASINLTTAS